MLKARRCRSGNKNPFLRSQNQGYSRTSLHSIKTEEEKNTRRERTDSNVIPLVSTFSPASLALNLFAKSHFQHLQTSIPCFSQFKIISAYKRNKNLKDILVHASLKEDKPQSENTHFHSVKYITNKFMELSGDRLFS